MPGGILFDAVSETTNCLPDAIQLLTPCTIGNGWMRILNLGRYALSLFDKKSGEGVRVFVDPMAVREWPETEAWFFKLKPKTEQDSAQLLDEIRRAGKGLYGAQPIRMAEAFSHTAAQRKHHLLHLVRRTLPRRRRGNLPGLPGGDALCELRG